MEQTFDSILSSFLEAYDNRQGKTVDEIISDKLTEKKVSKEAIEYARQANCIVDSYRVKYDSLRQAKENGLTREEWMQNEIIAIGEKNNLTEDQILQLQDAVGESVLSGVNNDK